MAWHEGRAVLGRALDVKCSTALAVDSRLCLIMASLVVTCCLFLILLALPADPGGPGSRAPV